MNVARLLAFLLSYSGTSVAFLGIAYGIRSKLPRSHRIHLYRHSIIHRLYLGLFI